jgi:hypothetical protein
MQWTVSQRLKSAEFGFNYTFGKSIDLGSKTESESTNAVWGFITNPWNPGLHKAVSDYDLTHQWNLYGMAELPFGKGKKWASHGGIIDALFGGWQLSGIYRQSSGFPIGVRNGRAWPTNWQWQGFATQLVPVGETGSYKNAPAVAGPGGPNIFPDPNAAVNAFDYTLPGGTGNRNVLRGDGYFTIDGNLAKSFRMPYHENHRLQIRWEVFNVTNSVRFDVASMSIDIGLRGSFGRYAGLLTQPRVMQFGARYEF